MDIIENDNMSNCSRCNRTIETGGTFPDEFSFGDEFINTHGKIICRGCYEELSSIRGEELLVTIDSSEY